MMLQIVLTIVIVFVLGLAFALTSLKLGRGDKRPGCGHGTCASCNPANRDATCPSESEHTGTKPAASGRNSSGEFDDASQPEYDGIDSASQPEYDRIAAANPGTDSTEAWDTDTDVEFRPEDADTEKSE